MKNIPWIMLMVLALFFWGMAGWGAYDWATSTAPMLPNIIVASRLAWLVFLILVGLQLVKGALESMRHRRTRDNIKHSIF